MANKLLLLLLLSQLFIIFSLIYLFMFLRYIGYIPQLKYRIGRTYGDHTHELAQVSFDNNNKSMIICDCLHLTFSDKGHVPRNK